MNDFKKNLNTMKNEIKITIGGSVGSGKSTVGYLLDQHLRSLGFNVKYNVSSDYRNYKDFVYIFKRNLNNGILEAIKNNSVVTMEDIQYQRGNPYELTQKLTDKIIENDMGYLLTIFDELPLPLQDHYKQEYPHIFAAQDHGLI